MKGIPVLPLIAVGILLAFQSSAVDHKPFDDDFFFYGTKRPAQLHGMEGKPAPKLTLTVWIGAKQDLAKLKGKIVVVDFSPACFVIDQNGVVRAAGLKPSRVEEGEKA